jgi:Family of unknown function (DUF5990)
MTALSISDRVAWAERPPRAMMTVMLIRIEGFDLPGRSCGPGPDYPSGHHNVHVAVQGRKGQQDLLGLVPADVPTATWELECVIASRPPDEDLKGAQIMGSAGTRFIYLTWGVVSDQGSFAMFRRAKLWLDAVPSAVMETACDRGLLVGRLGLSDHKGWPICAAVRPPRMEWTAEPTGSSDG